MALSVSDIAEDKTFITFKLHLPENGDYTIVNKFRQILTSEISTLAIDLIDITVNTSDTYDEILAHRLGLITITVPSNGITTKTDYFDLEIEARENTIVTSSYLTAGENGGSRPAYDDMIICKLKKGQALKLRAHFKWGTGDVHDKWSPVTSNTTYRKLKNDLYHVQVRSKGSLPTSDLINSALTIYNKGVIGSIISA